MDTGGASWMASLCKATYLASWGASLCMASSLVSLVSSLVSGIVQWLGGEPGCAPGLGGQRGWVTSDPPGWFCNIV